MIKSFIFYYNNYYPVHQDTKYSTSYWLQEPKLDKLRGTKEADLLQKLNQDLIATFSNISAKAVLQEYAQAANSIKLKVLVAAYQGLKDH